MIGVPNNRWLLTITTGLSSNTRLFDFRLRDFLNETHFPTLCRPPEAHARVSRSDAHARRASGTPGAAREGPGAVGRLSRSDRKRLGRRQRLGHREIVALLGARPVKRPGLSIVLKANAVGFCRLGLIVPKRVFPRAVDRSRAKRMLREWFRAHEERLGARDILIRLTGREVSFAELDRCVGVP